MALIAEAVDTGGQTRRLSSQNAVENRRLCRQLSKIAKDERKRNRDDWVSEKEQTVQRLIREFYRGTKIYRVVFQYEYWTARLCGFDVCRAVYRRSPTGELLAPEESPLWKWWLSLPYQSRKKMVELTKVSTAIDKSIERKKALPNDLRAPEPIDYDIDLRFTERKMQFDSMKAVSSLSCRVGLYIIDEPPCAGTIVNSEITARPAAVSSRSSAFGTRPTAESDCSTAPR